MRSFRLMIKAIMLAVVSTSAAGFFSSAKSSECEFNPFVPIIHALCPATPGDTNNPEGFWACNETGEDLLTAIAFLEEGNSWSTKGWTFVENEACAKMHDSLNNTRFYLYGISESGKEWSENYRFCISGDMNPLRRANLSDFCEIHGGEMKGFFSVWVPNMVTGEMPSHYVHVFGPNNQNLNHPRAER